MSRKSVPSPHLNAVEKAVIEVWQLVENVTRHVSDSKVEDSIFLFGKKSGNKDGKAMQPSIRKYVIIDLIENLTSGCNMVRFNSITFAQKE